MKFILNNSKLLKWFINQEAPIAPIEKNER